MKDRIKSEQRKDESQEVTEEQCLEAWRLLEQTGIARDQNCSDYARKNPDMPK